MQATRGTGVRRCGVGTSRPNKLGHIWNIYLMLLRSSQWSTAFILGKIPLSWGSLHQPAPARRKNQQQVQVDLTIKSIFIVFRYVHAFDLSSHKVHINEHLKIVNSLIFFVFLDLRIEARWHSWRFSKPSHDVVEGCAFFRHLWNR